MTSPRSYTPVNPNVGLKKIVELQSVVTKIKEYLTSAAAKGVSSEDISKTLNKTISDYCKTVQDEALREQEREALVQAAKKWYYILTKSFETANRNLMTLGGGDIYKIGNDSKCYINEIRPTHDRGVNFGKPLIADYEQSVKIAMKALAADPPQTVTRRDGKIYKMPLRNRAEIAVRFEINVRELNDFARKGVDLVWTSQHPNCSPRCKDFQGKLWSISGKSGVIDGIPYRPLAEAIQGKQKDGNGIITGYNCRHRLIEYKKGSRPPQELSEAKIRKEYALDTRMRAYENRIRQMKTEEKLLRSIGAIDSAKELRKKWRKETLEYKAFAFENGRAYERARCVVDESELNLEEFYENELTNDGESGILNTDNIKSGVGESVAAAAEQTKQFAPIVDFSKVTNVKGIKTINETLAGLKNEYPTRLLYVINAKNLNEKKEKSKCLARASGGSLTVDIDYLNNPSTVSAAEEQRERLKSQERFFQEVLANPKGYSRGWVKKAKEALSKLKYIRFSISSSLNNRLQTTIIHEYGHILADQYFGQLNGSKFCKNYAEKSESREMVESAYEIAMSTGDIYNISEYANRNSREFFAECFAAFKVGYDLPDYVVRMLKETLKR